MQAYYPLIATGIQTIILLLGVYGVILHSKWSIVALAQKIDGMQDELKKLATVITTQAVQTERLDNLSTRVTLLMRTVEDLRRGNGYVKGNRNGVDGEYE